MTVEKRYEGINHELLRDIVCDLFELYGFNITCDNKKYSAGKRSALKVHICGKRKTGWFSTEKAEASIIGQLNVETVLTIWGNSALEGAIIEELSKYFQKVEVPELIS